MSLNGVGGGVPPEIRPSSSPAGGRQQRSRSRSPPQGRSSNRRHRSRSPPSRSASPPRRNSRRNSRSRSPRSGGGGGSRRRDRSRSWSRSHSRSRSPRSRGRPYRDDYRGRGPRGPPIHRGPPPDFRGDYGRYDHGPPFSDQFGHPRGPPPPYGDYPPFGPPGPFGPHPFPPHHPHHHHPPPYMGPPPPQRRGGGGGGGGGRGRSRGDEGEPGVSLLIRNVSPDITPQDLHNAFGRIGEVRDVYIPRDFHSQQPKGFAFIEYATAEMAREAREEMDRFKIRGRELEVVYAQEKRKSPNEMRSRVVNPQNREGANFERSSSFERHKQKERGDKGSQRSAGSHPEDRGDDAPHSEE